MDPVDYWLVVKLSGSYRGYRLPGTLKSLSGRAWPPTGAPRRRVPALRGGTAAADRALGSEEGEVDATRGEPGPARRPAGGRSPRGCCAG
jgi:hypothetical protein